MKGLSNKVNSNRRLAKRFKRLNNINFCKFDLKFITSISCLKTFPFDLHDLFPTESNYIYRACQNETSKPFESINRIKYNSTPQYISRANVKNQGIAYYANALDIAIIESCQDTLRNSNEREFSLTVSKWKIKKKLSTQIVCNSKKTQNVGTDLALYCKATTEKRRNEMDRKYYRTYFLKTKFLADQYSKTNIDCEKDYYISALHSKTALNSKNNINAITYPSVGYLYLGFNYAISPKMFDDFFFELNEVYDITVKFDKIDYLKYPKWEVINSTKSFVNDKILWK